MCSDHQAVFNDATFTNSIAPLFKPTTLQIRKLPYQALQLARRPSRYRYLLVRGVSGTNPRLETMPGLLDLPPELLEQIYDEYHEETYWDDSAHLGDLRLTCRYVEKSIRRRFLINECSETAVKTFEEASIQKFRAMSSASEFAKAVKCVKLVLYDDSTIVPQNGTLQQRPRDTDASSAGNPDSSGDLKTVAQAPLLYHEDGILKALRACGNINELQFLALGPDPKALHHDMTSTFGFVLSLLVRAGIYPTHIGMIRNLGVWLPVGLIDAAGLIAGKEALRRLERLELGFLQHGHSDSDSAEEA